MFSSQSYSKPLFQLQLLFGFMDRGLQSVYNPESLVKVLRLDAAVQQDAQDLFLNLLDRQFEAQKDETIRNFIKDHFCGSYSYKTRCSKCGTEKSQKCDFYDIMVNIKDKCTLTDCLDEFVEAEELTGSDQSIQFEELPEVLNISLMRYSYDKETWLKKKSFDMVRFPEVIDFSEYLNKAVKRGPQGQEQLYDLSAVLVHSGTSAYLGHYMANVWNPALSQWTLLNDDQVEVFEKDAIFDPDAYTGIDGHLNGPKKPKSASKATRTDVEKKLQTLSTKNAYMLTYIRRKPAENRSQPIAPPSRVMEEVAKQNERFEEESAKEEQILEKFIENPDSAPPPTEEVIGMANATIVCTHGKLDPMSIIKAKRINKTAGLKLINDRMDVLAPILTDQDLCEPCVARHTLEMLYSNQHRKDIEEFERKNKSAKSPSVMWVSKSWLSEWLKKIPKFRSAEHEEGAERRDTIIQQEDPSPMSGEYLSDVFCSHGNLATDKARRKLVNKSALEVLQRRFGNLDLPTSDSVECPMCMMDQSADMANKQQLMDIAAHEKKELATVLMRGETPPIRNPGDMLYVINKDFLQLWLTFVKRPTTADRPTMCDNTPLLCEHDGLLYDVLSDDDVKNSDDIALLRDNEWVFFRDIYKGAPDIFFVEPPPAKDGNPIREFTVSSHQVCTECRKARQLNYESIEVTICIMTKADQSKAEYEARKQASNEEAMNSIMGADSNLGASKKRIEPITTYSRRSKRARNAKTNSSSSTNKVKSIKIRVNKSDTVMDLKLKIMQKTDVVPLYQQLNWNMVELDNNEATMGHLGILPRSTLDMVIFEENGDHLNFAQLDDYVPPEPPQPMELG
ncbi:hypothetical protein BGZ73_006342 [Actinomortierella ambigua]|nr:hypothetical protein BGZ73_006342 [Actinomortierella ambigua]